MLEQVEVTFRINSLDCISAVTADAWGLSPEQRYITVAIHLARSYLGDIRPPVIQIFQEGTVSRAPCGAATHTDAEPRFGRAGRL